VLVGFQATGSLELIEMVQYIPAVLNGNVGDAESLMFI
jgi:hypothetical protein